MLLHSNSTFGPILKKIVLTIVYSIASFQSLILLRIILSLTLLCCGSIAFGQSENPFIVKRFNVENGLSNNWISDIYQDENAYLWIATQYGVNRFDGKNFTQYTYNPNPKKGISGNWIRAIKEYQNGKLLFSTFGAGVNTYDLYSDQFTNASLKAIGPNILIRKIISIDENHQFMASNYGLIQFDTLSQAKVIYESQIQDIASYKDKILIGSSNDGLIAYGFDAPPQLISSGKDINGIRGLNTDSIIAFENGLLHLYTTVDQENWDKVSLDISIKNLSRQQDFPFVYRTQDGSIFTSGLNGVWELSKDLRRRTFHPLSNFFPDLQNAEINAHCFVQDHEGSYWLGTNQGLLQLKRPKPFVHPKLQSYTNPLPGVREITGLNDRYFFAMPEKLLTWDASLNEPPQEVLQEQFLALHMATDQNLYGVSEKTDPKQLFIIDPITLKYYKKNLPEVESQYRGCWKITEDQENRLWISLWNQLICYDLKSGEMFSVVPPVPNNQAPNILDIIIDQKDRLWVATISFGLLRIDNISKLKENTKVSLTQYKYDPNEKESIICDLVLQMFEAKDGTLWVSTDGGLNHFFPEEGRFEPYLRNADMVDDKIMGITQDANGTFWMSTISHGILSFNFENNRFQNFRKSDGLLDNSMMISSVFQDNKGRIWMGSEGGLISFLPEQVIKDKPNQGILLWEELKLYQEDSILITSFPNKRKTENIVLSPSVHTAQFDFTYTAFQERKNILFRFKLEGYHNTWLPSQSQGVFALAQLPSGDYQLHVEALTHGGEVIASYPPISLQVLAPWYKTAWAYGLYVLFGLALVYTFYRIQIQRLLALADKQRSEEMIAEKVKWFQKIAHEFRTPLTIIFGAVDLIRSSKNENDKIHDSRVEQIADQATHLTRQIDEILELAKIQEGTPRLQLETGDFIAFQNRILSAHQHLANQKNIELNFKSNIKVLYFDFDHDKWHKITGNLLSNALKFTEPKGKVLLDVNQQIVEDNSLLTLKVQDNGSGIPKQLFPHLFEPFRQAEVHQEQGTGLGLALTKALVELHGGTIEVESTFEVGSTFTIKLPILEKVNHPEKIETTNHTFTKETSEAKVLIVEDNPEILTYIESCLQDRYEILKAKDGLEAWDICQKQIPDLVLSDVMMPGRSGIELSRMIRSDQRTNHIPLILLTAKSGDVNRMEGLEAGADEYLTKPFRRRELELRIERLLAYQKRLIEKYRSGDFSVQQVSKISDTFMLSVVDIIKKKLSDEDFKVQVLADALHLSRVQVFRKIKALTGQTPTLFIRQVRLQTARQLLLQSDQTIAEIAFQVGFKDPAYFTRVFTEVYGTPPSSLR